MPSVLKLNLHVYQAIVQYIKILLKTRLCCLIINMQNSTTVYEDYHIFSVLTEWLSEWIQIQVIKGQE